ncbi:ferredoxin [Candidatus Parcubacteria bacterium]|nr:ferredoxin [Candidatus Parcubacteria bacterium]
MVKVNKEKCLGCGYCTSVCPEVFEIGDDGKSQVKKGADLEKNKDCIQQAKEGCPVGAIED